MNNLPNTTLHPIERASALDSTLRLWLQNPNRIIKNYIRPGLTVLDLGCGTGYFTLEIAKLVGKKGKVIATDVQQGMPDILKQKLKNSDVQGQIQIHQNPENSLNLTEKVDFILAFYAFHEMKYIDTIIGDLTKIVKPETKILISEQKFHVSRNTFNTIIHKMEKLGFVICETPKVFLSRTVVMKLESSIKTQESRQKNLSSDVHSR